MILVDIDKIFDEKIREFIKENIGKYTEDELEDKVATLYKEFGETALPQLGGKTPETYYSGSGASLVELLTEHIKLGVPVSDFLCRAIMDKEDAETPLMNLIQPTNNEELVVLAINILDDMKSQAPLKKYVSIIYSYDYNNDIKETVAGILVDHADLVKEDILAVYGDLDDYQKQLFDEILSYCKQDDRIFNILVSSLESCTEIAFYAELLRRYGDIRCIDTLIKVIERDDINYSEFRELKFTIEELGGEYDKKRDFTSDAVYKKINKFNKEFVDKKTN